MRGFSGASWGKIFEVGKGRKGEERVEVRS